MKKPLYLLLFFYFISLPSTFSQVNLRNGLVACYPFNGNASNQSNSRNNGTVNGATLTTDRFGKPNSAYNFDGNDYIQLANPEDFKNNTFTYSAWVNIPISPSTSDAYSPFSFGGQTMHFINRQTEGLVWGFTAYNDQSVSYDINPSSSQKTTLGTWHHFVITRSETQAKIYVDGELLVTTTTSVQTTPSYNNISNTSLLYYPRIGTRQDGYANNIQFFKGSIDDMHFYNRAINAAEVKALYEGDPQQNITISLNKSVVCGGDSINFVVNGVTTASKYLWKIDSMVQVSNSSIFTYIPTKRTGDYSVNVSVEISTENGCFPQKSLVLDTVCTIKDCTPPPPPLSVNLKNGLVACYPFNGNATSQSSSRNNGTVNGATLTTDRFGKPNSAYNFDGNDYIQLANPDDFKNNTSTYSAWVYMPIAPSSNSHLDAFTVLSIGNGQVLSFINRPTEGLVWGFTTYNDQNVSYDINPSSTKKTELNAWHHFVAIRSETQAKIYVDGELLLTATTPVPTTPAFVPSHSTTVTYQATIGTRPDATNIQFFKGIIDDIHIYNRPINAAEVKALYEGSPNQNIFITYNKSSICGGDSISFFANGGTPTSRYQWKV
ncbi:MAG: LamG domain-containing protein, partial [Leadbetterella sp.]